MRQKATTTTATRGSQYADLNTGPNEHVIAQSHPLLCPVSIENREMPSAASAGVDVVSVEEVNDVPTLEEALELCSSNVREKKLVGMLLVTKVMTRETPTETLDAVARALGSKFLDELLKPKATAEAEDAAMSATLGLNVCRVLCRSDKFAGSKTMEYWFRAFVDAGGKRGVYGGLSDEAAADALMCAFAYSLVKAKLGEGPHEAHGEGIVFETAIEALQRSRGELPLSKAAVSLLDLEFTSGMKTREDLSSLASCVPPLCKLMSDAVGDEVQLSVLSLLFMLFSSAFGCGWNVPEDARLDKPDEANADWQRDCLCGLWIVLSSRTPRDVRFMAMALASFVANYSGGRWFVRSSTQPPSAVLAGAVSGGATKKVPSFLTLVSQLVRVEVNVAFHTLLSDGTSEEGAMKALNDAQSSLALFETLIEALSTVAEDVDAEAFELSNEMGKLSAEELQQVMQTLHDVTGSLLECFEDEDDRKKIDPMMLLAVLRCVGCHIAQAPEIESRRVATLMPYWFGGFLDEFRGDDDAVDTATVSLVRFFAGYFVMTTQEAYGIENMIESGWLKLTCETLATKRAEMESPLDAMFVDMTTGVLGEIMKNIVDVESSSGLSVETKNTLGDLMNVVSRALGDDVSDADDELALLFGRVSIDGATAFDELKARIGGTN